MGKDSDTISEADDDDDADDYDEEEDEDKEENGPCDIEMIEEEQDENPIDEAARIMARSGKQSISRSTLMGDRLTPTPC